MREENNKTKETTVCVQKMKRKNENVTRIRSQMITRMFITKRQEQEY